MLDKIIIILLILLSTPCFSEDRIYSYTDENGNKVYTSEKKSPAPPKKPTNNYQQYSFPSPSQKSNIIEFRDLPKTSPSFQDIENKNSTVSRNTRNYTNVNQAKFSPRPNISNSLDKAAKTFAGFTLIVGSISILLFVIWIVALIDVLRNEFTGSNKLIWFLTVTFVPIIGPVLYFIIGDKYKIIPEDPYKTY